MKIIITENQFKRLIENIIKEQDTIFDDPRANALVNFLIDRGEEVGFSSIKNVDTRFHQYGVDDKIYAVLTKEEADRDAWEMAYDMLKDDPLRFTSKETIIEYSPILKDNKVSHEILDIIINNMKQYGKDPENYKTTYKILNLLISDYGDFARYAIKKFGRSWFLPSITGEEFKSGDYYIYIIDEYQ